MRGPDSDPLSPEIATALMAVDATLAGEPVDPEYAELAELALILRRERPRTSDTFAATLDDRVERRFARPARAARGTGLRRWLFGPVAGLAAAAAGVAVVIVVAGSSGGGASSASSSSAAAVASQTVAASSSASAGGSAAAAPDVKRAAAPKTALGLNESAAAASSASSSSTSAGSSAVPSPVIPGGRQVVQSAQLQLSTAPSRIDDVAQQVFNVVGAEKGFVDNSNVTSGGGSANAGASFQLSVPSANLAATLTDLSRLRGAHVVSRTDQTNDITGEVGGAGQKLAEARALRRSLLKQLANATTTEQVNSIEARLHDANASIASDLATLRGLQRQVAYSKISLNIEPSTAPPPVTTHHSSGFGIGQAAHDAGRVLVVVAGVALIVLAVLVPVGLVGALAAWVGFAIRRRRREQALDLV
ncbi:MAG: DUF4349 domain-containing protein [Solirubrobacteraceae bacterium]